MMTKNLAKSDKKWGEGVKIGVGGNEAFELVRSGEPQKSLRGVERKNRVAKNCISMRKQVWPQTTCTLYQEMGNPKRVRSRGVNEGES